MTNPTIAEAQESAHKVDAMIFGLHHHHRVGQEFIVVEHQWDAPVHRGKAAIHKHSINDLLRFGPTCEGDCEYAMALQEGST